MSKVEPNVTILLATFNGDHYLKDQIESIIRQTHSHWELWIRDDCSTDNTIKLINSFMLKDNRIKMLSNHNKRLGACMNFAELMEHVDCANYISFSDQDDVWHPYKIEMTLKKILEEEKRHGNTTPILVHTDFEFVNSELIHLKAKKNIAYRFSNQPELIANKLLSQNYIYGCTMLINKSLLRASLPISQCAENHDYWIALVASCIGKVFFIPNKAMSFKQHGSNVSMGLKASSFRNRFNRVFLKWPETVKLKDKRIEQIVALRDLLKDQLPFQKQKLLNDYIDIAKKGGIQSILFSMENQIRRQGVIQTFLFYCSLYKKYKKTE